MSTSSTAARSYTCAYCSKSSPSVASLCARCQTTRYCDRECQKAHWKAHKVVCVATTVGTEEKKTDGAVKKKKSSAATASTSAPTSAANASSSSASGERAPTIEEMLEKPKLASRRVKAASSSSASSSTAAPLLTDITFSLPSSTTPSHPLIAVRDIPNKGRGFVAINDIPAGTLLLAEESIYAHSEGINQSEERRTQTLVQLTKMMLEKYPEQLKSLCHHSEHELPEHALIDTPPSSTGLDTAQWHDVLVRVDSNQFTSARGMMVSPTVAIFNHSCYPKADLIIREVPVTDSAATSSSSSSSSTKSVERVHIYSIDDIKSGEEITINYLGSDSLCRWYSPSMIRQDSFKTQWQFTCDCLRCVGSKAKAIDRAIFFTEEVMSDELDKRYTDLILAENPEQQAGPDPFALLQLYRDLYQLWNSGNAVMYHHYLLHQIRTLLIFMPVAFNEEEQKKRGMTLFTSFAGVTPKSSSSSSSSAASIDDDDETPVTRFSRLSASTSGEIEYLTMIDHHLHTLKNNLLNPPLHSIKSDSIQVVMKSADFVGGKFAKLNQSKSGNDVTEHTELRKAIVASAHEWDPVYLENPTFEKLYPETRALMMKYYVPEE